MRAKLFGRVRKTHGIVALGEGGSVKSNHLARLVVFLYRWLSLAEFKHSELATARDLIGQRLFNLL